MKISTDLFIKNINKKSNKHEIIIFGFWIYLMSDCILFATLFAVYFVLKNQIAYGPSGKDIFNLNFVLIETIILLLSSISYAISMFFIKLNKKSLSNLCLFLTFLFGFIFIFMECYEFCNLINHNNGPNQSAFLSIFFVLVGTHCLHVFFGLVWILVMILHIIIEGITSTNKIRLKCLGLFWHFLDIIWICLYTTVYLIGSF